VLLIGLRLAQSPSGHQSKIISLMKRIAALKAEVSRK
jgi:hypothetical protein